MEVGGTWEPWRLEVREDEGNDSVTWKGLKTSAGKRELGEGGLTMAVLM